MLVFPIGSSSNAFISNLYKVLSGKILFTLTFLKKKILWCYIHHAILNSYYNHMEDVRFYSLDSFFFLRILCDIFNITFHICYLKPKLWGGFPSKISFWMSHTPHENSPFPVTQKTLSASYMHTYKHVHSFLRPDSYQETYLSVFY